MAKEFITQGDLIPEWLKHLAGEDLTKEAEADSESYKGEHHETTFQIPDLQAANKASRQLVLFMDAQQAKGSATAGSLQCQVGAFWKGDAQGRQVGGENYLI